VNILREKVSCSSYFMRVPKTNFTSKTETLIYQLNPVLRGWANYFRHVVSKKTFSHIDQELFWILGRWMHRRHSNKSWSWRFKRYYRSIAQNHWRFFSRTRKPDGSFAIIDLLRVDATPIKRHIKIQSCATPYYPAFVEYFIHRKPIKRQARISGVLSSWAFNMP